MTTNTSQIYESYLPVYNAVPEEWDNSRPFLVENLKKMSEGINAREIGFYLEEQLLSGKQFIPTPTMAPGEFRSVFRKVVDTGALVIGANAIAHGINFDSRFTLVHLYVSATNSTGLTAITMSNPTNVTMDATNINITAPGAYDRSYAVIEYLLEV